LPRNYLGPRWNLLGLLSSNVSFGAGVTRFHKQSKNKGVSEDADNPVPRLGPDTPSISIIRWATTTCLSKAVCRNDQPSLSKDGQPHQAKRCSRSYSCRTALRSNPRSRRFASFMDNHLRLLARTQRVAIQSRRAVYRVIVGGHLMHCMAAMPCQQRVAQQGTVRLVRPSSGLL
jgi:hypothetical protein